MPGEARKKVESKKTTALYAPSSARTSHTRIATPASIAGAAKLDPHTIRTLPFVLQIDTTRSTLKDVQDKNMVHSSTLQVRGNEARDWQATRLFKEKAK